MVLFRDDNFSSGLSRSEGVCVAFHNFDLITPITIWKVDDDWVSFLSYSNK